MKKTKKLLTLMMAAVFFLTMTSTAMAVETSEIRPEFSEASSEFSAELLPGDTGEDSKEELEENVSAEPSVSPEPKPSATSAPSEVAPSESAASASLASDAAASSEPPLTYAEEEASFVEIAPMMLVPGADVTVTTWDDFKQSVEQAEVDGKMIRIDASLAGTMPAALTMNIAHSNSVVIDGGGATFASPSGARAFTYNNTGSGSVTLQNMTLDATGGAGAISLNGTSILSGVTLRNVNGTAVVAGGTLTVSDCIFSDTNGVGISGGNNVTVKNTLFENVRNNLGGHGSAIFSTGNLTVEYSSFVNSASTLDAGYIQGAIVAYGGSGRTVSVTRSYFKDNKSSRYGGAIGFYQFGGTANIGFNYFEGNGVSGKNANSDGGAIGVYNNSSSTLCTVNIDNNTFIGNTAQDDGSAVFLEGKNHMVVGNFTNNTFFGNKATKYFLYADSGGVVQLSLDITGHFKNNTFIGNTTSTSTGMNGRGAAVGEHIDSANSANRPTATFQNNIMVGNGGGNAAYRNVDITNGTDLGGNVGYDNGTALDPSVTADAVFGTNPQPRANSTNYGAAGNPGSGHIGTLKTVTILPNDGVTGLADNAAGAPVFSKDARGYARDSAASDAGAMEIKFVKFDANGGEWSGLSAFTYDGSKYYADGAASTGYFLVTDPGGSVSVLTSDLPANGALIFDGWYTQAVGGTEVTGSVTATDQTLYAHWKDDTVPISLYTLTFDSQGGTPVDPITDIAAGSTVAEPVPPTRDGYSFDGWHSTPDCVCDQTAPCWDFARDTVNEDKTLYARWIPTAEPIPEPAPEPTPEPTPEPIPEPIPEPQAAYTVSFDAQGGSAVDPITGIVSGARINPPQNPIRAGYVFRGWYTESACENVWMFAEHTVEGDMTLYAKWDASSGAAGTTADGGGPKTGDSSVPITILIIAAAGAAALIVRTAIALKKRNDNS